MNIDFSSLSTGAHSIETPLFAFFGIVLIILLAAAIVRTTGNIRGKSDDED